MKKKLLMAVVFAFAFSIYGTVFAAQTLVDVPANHWAYASVTKLIKLGIIDGYGDGTFKGDKTITRYEMAVMVSKAMDNYSKASDADKTEILKLVTEFSGELDKLGVRVASLEKNQSNLKITGNFDMRYHSYNYINNQSSDSVNGQYKLRINGDAKVDDNTTFSMRFITKNGTNTDFKQDTWLNFGADNNSVNIDRAFLITKLADNITTTVGRQSPNLDPNSLLLEANNQSYDGIRFNAQTGNFEVVVHHGRIAKGVAYSGAVTTVDLGSTMSEAAFYNPDYANIDIDALTVNYKEGNFNGGMAYDCLKNDVLGITLKKWSQIYGTYLLEPQLSISGQYVKDNVATSNNTATFVMATYGDQVLAARGQKNIYVKYYNIGGNALIPRFTTLNTVGSDAVGQGWTGIEICPQYAFSSTFSGEVQYVKIRDKVNSLKDYDFYRVLLHLKF